MTVDIQKLRELANSATPGPWFTPDERRLQGAVSTRIGERECQVAAIDGDAAMFDHRAETHEIQHANGAFIAAARTAVPALLDEVERLRREADEMGLCMLEEFAKYKERRNEQFAAFERARHATIAYLLDRAEQYSNSSGYRAFIDELVGDIAEWRHVQCAEAGEYDDLKERVDRIIASHLPSARSKENS